ncbi:DUF4129 domain-containing transglutaminase family protein [Ornithinibacillus halophilus]|uniref:Transglutaminase-like domain-containing protein n=1 Tax=Ornithinibacillus halophilus TaxID=930117 RepID=A0A1M5HDB5_9BACI|nr:transglutaminase domain-containing protein [Ornithinibacillus halophilus]SHG13901.1 protein of unknown function [Ornithinibacillus halophilus]
MSKVNTNKIPILFTSILYILGLFLFLEWLYPVKEVTDTSNLNVFIIFTLFCFIITILQVHWSISFLLKGFGILFIINGLYSEYSLFSKIWFSELFTHISYNLQLVFSMQWQDLTGMFRSILFLIIIWLMSYLIHYWFVLMKRIFIFVVLTFVYLTVLDTFTIYDSTFPIIRTFILSFLALGMTNFFKEVQLEGIRFSWTKKNPIWIVPLISIVLFSAVIGYAAPKLDPKWPDPVPFIQGVTGNGPGGVVQKVGYGEDDTRLGGSFVQDYSPVFQAVSKEEHYWRIESKDTYTGKGWVKSDDSGYVAQQNGFINYGENSDEIETTRLDATIKFEEDVDIPKLLYPYGIKKAEEFYDLQQNPLDVDLLLNEENGEIITQLGNEEATIPVYSVLYDYPSYSRNSLRAQREFESQELVERYTQLPSSLPERVKDLAHELTDGYSNQYDKVTAIEGYFSRNGFEYQTTEVPVPGADEDYVDQFLFDSKVGYCDNFSTSMVVMLRTLDIPSRWVKGFTSGEKVTDFVEGDTSYDVYEVTNANAHSWVEVYFEDIGWVPFEPTKGFSNLSDFYTDYDSDNDDDFLDAPEPPELEQPELEEEPDPLTPEDEEDSVEAMNPNGDGSSGGGIAFQLSWWHYVIFGAILLAILFVLFKFRFQVRMYWLMNKLEKKQDAETYQDAYHFMLKLLGKKGFSKEPNQTLREYAQRVDTWYRTDSMATLTSEYEKIIYKNDFNHLRLSEVKDLWKNLIKKILG